MPKKNNSDPKKSPFIFDSKFASIYSDNMSQFAFELPIISKFRKSSNILSTEDIYRKILNNISACEKQLFKLKHEVHMKIADIKQLPLFEIF